MKRRGGEEERGREGAGVRWLSRPRHDETLCSQRTIWETRDHQFRVVHSRPTLHGLIALFYAMARDAQGWRIISRHHKKAPAFRAVEALARKEFS